MPVKNGRREAAREDRERGELGIDSRYDRKNSFFFFF